MPDQEMRSISWTQASDASRLHRLATVAAASPCRPTLGAREESWLHWPRSALSVDFHRAGRTADKYSAAGRSKRTPQCYLTWTAVEASTSYSTRGRPRQVTRR